MEGRPYRTAGLIPSLLGLAELALRQGNIETIREVAAKLETVAPKRRIRPR